MADDPSRTVLCFSRRDGVAGLIGLLFVHFLKVVGEGLTFLFLKPFKADVERPYPINAKNAEVISEFAP